MQLIVLSLKVRWGWEWSRFRSVGIWPRSDPSHSGWVRGLRRDVLKVILGFDLVVDLNFDIKESSRPQNWG